MKLYKWLYGAMALTMLGACSDHDLAPEGTQGSGNGSGNTVSGYMAVEIKLPQTGGTRADGSRAEDTGAINDNYADGTANEYDVDNALIVLFKGKKADGEKKAKFYRAQDLKKTFFTNLPEDDNISASYIAAIEVKSKPASDENIWAMVILNRNEATTNNGSEGTGEDEEEYIMIAGDRFTKKNTFEEILAATTENPFVVKDETNNEYSKFFMTNAPMADKAGNTNPITNANIHYLTDLGNTIYDTPDEAKTNLSGCIYVERAVAKFTCKTLDKNNLHLTFIDENGDEIDTKDWTISASVKYALTNTPKTSYVIRNVEFDNDDHFEWTFANKSRYRMIGLEPMPGLGTPFHGDEQNLYRTYWCKDPYYETSMPTAQKNVVTAANQFTSIKHPLYAKENTFVVKNQTYKNTTIALFEVDFSITDENDEGITELYIKDGNTSRIYVTPEAAYADGITRIYNNIDIQNAVKECVVAGKTLPNDFNIKNVLDIEIQAEAQAGDTSGYKYLVVKSINLVKDNNYFNDASVAAFRQKIGAADGSSEIKTQFNLLTNVNALTDVTVYEGGISYYAVPVKHFGDYYTPWDKTIKGTTTDDVYNNGRDQWNDLDHARLYLGRYGVVRNNWYELNISKIAALGSPVIPDVNIDLSDDNNEDKKYFAVEIHILSWAKRLQNVEF